MLDHSEAKKLISGWFSEASDDIDTDRLETMLREMQAQVQSGVGCGGVHDRLIQALELELEARRRGEGGQTGSRDIQPRLPDETDTP